MSYRGTVHSLVPALVLSSLLFGQQSPPTLGPNATDFPVLLQQTVTAGKTPVGTRIEAKLSMATLYNGTVIPRNAVFSGAVVESSAKTTTDASRLAIAFDSARWKNGTASIRFYFNGWYYPAALDENGQDLQYGPPQPANRTWNGQGQYPDPNSKVYRPFPGGGDDDKGSAVPNTPASGPGKNRALIKDVEAERPGDGTIRLVSKRASIKLEKYTTYVVSAADSAPQK